MGLVTHGNDFIMDIDASTPFDATSSHLDADLKPFGARSNLSNFPNNSSRSVTPILPSSILLPASLPVRNLDMSIILNVKNQMILKILMILLYLLMITFPKDQGWQQEFYTFLVEYPL